MTASGPGNEGARAGGEPPAPSPPAFTLPDLRVDRDGEWWDGDVQITHAGILANLRGNIRRDAAGYFIQTRVRIPVRVDDVPFVVTRAERRGDELHGILSDGTDEVIDPGSVRLGADDVPYAAVKGGTFEARFSRAAAFQLLALADYDEASGKGTLRLRGADWPLERAS